MRRKPMSEHSKGRGRPDAILVCPGTDIPSSIRLRLWPYKILESFWTLVRHRATSALCHKRTSVPDVSRCSGVDHAEQCLEMANGKVFQCFAVSLQSTDTAPLCGTVGRLEAHSVGHFRHHEFDSH